MTMDLPITDQWFVQERVDDKIVRLYEPHVHPFLRPHGSHKDELSFHFTEGS